MELRQYIAILKKNIVIILALSAAGLVLALFAAKSLPQGYLQSRTFFVASTQIAQDSNSAYYNQEKARNFTDTAIAILESADFKKEAERGNGKIDAKKSAPQVIRISAASSTPEGAQTLLLGTQNAFNAKLSSLNAQNLRLMEVGEPQEPALSKVNLKVAATAGLILGFAFAVFTVSLKTYFKL